MPTYLGSHSRGGPDFQFLPPITRRTDILTAVDLARTAEVSDLASFVRLPHILKSHQLGEVAAIFRQGSLACDIALQGLQGASPTTQAHHPHVLPQGHRTIGPAMCKPAIHMLLYKPARNGALCGARSRPRILGGSPETCAPSQVVLLLVPGQAGAACMDESAAHTLSVLRSMGLPSVVGVSTGVPGAGLKERSAAKKLAADIVASQVL